MNVYERFGVRTVINGSGTSTRVGGALMPTEVVNAMSAAALESVSIVELQAAASRYIGQVTGAEAGYVTTGASAGLTLGTAAILAKLDLGKMYRLPDTTGMKNEFIIAREQRSGHDHAFRTAGARLIEVGMNEQVAVSGLRRTEAWEYTTAITDRTAGIVYVATPGSQPPFEQVVEIAHRHDLPVLVDAAGQLPPRSNLRAFVDLGADLVTFSGGKAIRGPQSTGILCGRREYVASAALQNLDTGEHFEIWDPPNDFIPKSSLSGIPREGIGRGFKVAKEEIIGLLTALKLFSEGSNDLDFEEQRQHLEYVVDGLSGLPVESKIMTPEGEGCALLHLVLDREELGRSGFQVCLELKQGNPGVFLSEVLLAQDTLVINPLNLNGPRTEALTHRLREVLAKRRDR